MKIRLIIEKNIPHFGLASILNNEENTSLEQNGNLLTPKQYKKIHKKLKDIEKNN